MCRLCKNRWPPCSFAQHCLPIRGCFHVTPSNVGLMPLKRQQPQLQHLLRLLCTLWRTHVTPQSCCCRHRCNTDPGSCCYQTTLLLLAAAVHQHAPPPPLLLLLLLLLGCVLLLYAATWAAALARRARLFFLAS